MHLILLMFLLVMIAVVSAGVLRRRREHRRAERAKALRYERWKARRQNRRTALAVCRPKSLPMSGRTRVSPRLAQPWVRPTARTDVVGSHSDV
jgi:septation ring formation regulator EzrA